MLKDTCNYLPVLNNGCLASAGVIFQKYMNINLFQNFYLIDSNLVMFLTALLSRRVLWCFVNEVGVFFINTLDGISVYWILSRARETVSSKNHLPSLQMYDHAKNFSK